MQAYVKSKTDEMLNLNNAISSLKKQLEQCERDAAVFQQEKDLALTATSQKTLEHGQVRNIQRTPGRQRRSHHSLSLPPTPGPDSFFPRAWRSTHPRQ